MEESVKKTMWEKEKMLVTFNIFYHIISTIQSPLIMTLRKNPLENTVGNRENAGNSRKTFSKKRICNSINI